MVTEPNLLVAGEPGSGKSITLIEILTTLVLNKTPEELQLYLFDLKQAAFYVFKNLPHVRENTHDRKKIKKCFEDLLKELNFRSDLLEKYEVPHINRLPKDVRPPYIIVGIDEFSLLDDNYSTTAIQNIAAIGRALGVYVILSTQRPDSKIVDGRIKALLTVRIGGRMQDVYNSRIIIDDAGCENLTTPGHMKAKTMNGITDVKVFLLEEDEALRLLEPYRIKKEVVIEENKEEAEAPKKSAKKVSSRKIKTSKVIDWRGAFK
jgi:S-DNA-T family DNA segregation ATPase FtsK/SpoIIIE